MSHCANCPIPEGELCPGERARRLCDLIDPAHKDHRPGYRESIVKAARQLAGQSFPPLPRQAANLAGALWDWAVAGFTATDDAERERRLSICRACEQYAAGRCRLCGCYLKVKVRMRTEHCPLPEPRW